VSSNMGPICDHPFSKDQRLHKFKLNLDAIRLFLHPLLCGGMACLSIFSDGVLINLYLICSHKSQIYIHVSRFVVHLGV
jgi:hypothetical protein